MTKKVPIKTKKCRLKKVKKCVEAPKEFTKHLPRKVKRRDCYPLKHKDHSYSSIRRSNKAENYERYYPKNPRPVEDDVTDVAPIGEYFPENWKYKQFQDKAYRDPEPLDRRYDRNFVEYDEYDNYHLNYLRPAKDPYKRIDMNDHSGRRYGEDLYDYGDYAEEEEEQSYRDYPEYEPEYRGYDQGEYEGPVTNDRDFPETVSRSRAYDLSFSP